MDFTQKSNSIAFRIPKKIDLQTVSATFRQAHSATSSSATVHVRFLVQAAVNFSTMGLHKIEYNYKTIENERRGGQPCGLIGGSVVESFCLPA
jgi:hypothetical protein